MKLSRGQCTSSGLKSINQDSQDIAIPDELTLKQKGAVAIICDGISSSSVSQQASFSAVQRFLEDYYCTSELWGVKGSIGKVLNHINCFLLSQTQNSPYQGNRDKGYVTTFSAIVVKQNTAHIVHIGDTRIYLCRDKHLTLLTQDHCVTMEGNRSYLSNALGIGPKLEFDYSTVSVEAGDYFILMTDGVYEHISLENIEPLLTQQSDLDIVAKSLVDEAYANFSQDNLTVGILGVIETQNEPTNEEEDDVYPPIPPIWQPGQIIDEFSIQRHLYQSARNHVYLATHNKTQTLSIIKAPSIDMTDNQTHIEQLLIEEWVARKQDSPHLLNAPITLTKRSFLYAVFNYFEGQTLAQWLLDNPNPTLKQVRDIIEQVSTGLLALHKKGILHQDIRPENILINSSSTIQIIDFGSAYINGVSDNSHASVPGTAIYAAPEYFIGDVIDEKADQFSLAVLCYYLLSGKYPYGTNVAKCLSVAAQKKLHYESVLDPKRTFPLWIDDTLRKALNPDPYKRYSTLSEFTFDLVKPNPSYVRKHRPPLMERDPVTFWKAICFLLILALLASFIG